MIVRKQAYSKYMFISVIVLIGITILPLYNSSITSTEINVPIEIETPNLSWFNNSALPISIDDMGSNNWAWARTQDWCRKGDGSENDPYVIENITINAMGTLISGIEIANSKVFFIINNVTIYNLTITTGYAGIKLISTSNGVISDCKILDCDTGIYLYASGDVCNNNTITGNTIKNAENFGIYIRDQNSVSIVDECVNNKILDNDISECSLGIRIWRGDNNSIEDNQILNNIWGLELYAGTYCDVINNEIENNNYGIMLDASPSNTSVISNLISSSSSYGIVLNAGTESTILYDNYFYENGVHAVDNGTYNQWDNGSWGNYWDDYDGVDENKDGIGDIPYNITGTAVSQDRYPLVPFEENTVANQAIPFGNIFLVFTIIGIFSIIIISRKRMS